MDAWTASKLNDLFTLKEMKNKPYETVDDAWMQVTIEMDLNRMAYSRSRYTVLELLAQFGGFIGIFGRIFGFFMAAWNFNALSNYMVTRLYKMRSFDVKNDVKEIDFKRSKFPHCCDYAMSWVPSPLAFCKKRGKEKALVTARQRLSDEMDMIKVIQQQRFLVAAMELLLKKGQIEKLKEQTQFNTVDLQTEMKDSD